MLSLMCAFQHEDLVIPFMQIVYLSHDILLVKNCYPYPGLPLFEHDTLLLGCEVMTLVEIREKPRLHGVPSQAMLGQ